MHQSSGMLLIMGWLFAASNVQGGERTIDRVIDFQQYRYGLPPTEFEFTATGPHGPVLSSGRPLWRTYVDLFAPSPKLVMIQASALAQTNHYALAILRDHIGTGDVALAVSCKFLGGTLARSAGIMLRGRDNQNYLAVMLDALELQVHALHMDEGRRTEVVASHVSFDAQHWNFLELAVRGGHIQVWLNNKPVLQCTRSEFAGDQSAPKAGLLTHADTVAVFDDFYLQGGSNRVRREVQPAQR